MPLFPLALSYTRRALLRVWVTLAALSLYFAFAPAAAFLNVYDGGNTERFYCIIESTQPSGYVAVGESNSLGGGSATYAMVMKLAQNGNEEWTKAIGTDGEEAYGIAESTQDSGYVVVGWAQHPSLAVNEFDAFIIKLDASGVEVWSRTFDGGVLAASGQGAYDQFQAVVESKQDSNGFVAVGDRDIDTTFTTGPGGTVAMVNTEVFIVKISSAGSVVWSKSYGTDPDIDRGYAIVESTQSTGYVVAGSGQPHGADHDMVMMKVDANGALQWATRFGVSTGEEHSHGVVEDTASTGYVLAGRTDSFGNEDVVLVKTTASGALDWCMRYDNSGGTENAESIVENTLAGAGFVISGATSGGSPPVALVMEVDGSGTVQATHTYSSPPFGTIAYGLVESTQNSGVVFAGAENSDAIMHKVGPTTCMTSATWSATAWSIPAVGASYVQTGGTTGASSDFPEADLTLAATAPCVLPSASTSVTPSQTSAASVTPSQTSAASVTPSISVTSSQTSSISVTSSQTSSISVTSSQTSSISVSSSETLSISMSPSISVSVSQSALASAVDVCTNNLCAVNATCVLPSGGGPYTCNCSTMNVAHVGRFCNVTTGNKPNTGPCKFNNCAGNTTCVNTGNSYKCNCSSMSVKAVGKLCNVTIGEKDKPVSVTNDNCPGCGTLFVCTNYTGDNPQVFMDALVPKLAASSCSCNNPSKALKNQFAGVQYAETSEVDAKARPVFCMEYTIYSGNPEMSPDDIINRISDNPPPGFDVTTDRPPELEFCTDVRGCDYDEDDSSLFWIVIGCGCFLLLLLLLIAWYFIHQRLGKQFKLNSDKNVVQIEVEMDDVKQTTDNTNAVEHIKIAPEHDIDVANATPQAWASSDKPLASPFNVPTDHP